LIPLIILVIRLGFSVQSMLVTAVVVSGVRSMIRSVGAFRSLRSMVLA